MHRKIHRINEGLSPATLLKKRLWHRCFPVNFKKFLRTAFFIEHFWTTTSGFSYWLHTIRSGKWHFPVDTRRRFNVYKTSIRRRYKLYKSYNYNQQLTPTQPVTFKQITIQKGYTSTTYNLPTLRLKSVRYTYTTCFQSLKLQILRYT